MSRAKPRDERSDDPHEEVVEVVETRPVEEWSKRKDTPAWKFAAARALRRWPEGLVVTEADFDRAADEAAHIPLSAPSIRA